MEDPALTAALASEALVFSATEASIDAGSTFEIQIPFSMDGGFLLYQYEERSGGGVQLTVTVDGRPLLEELQSKSSDRLIVPKGAGAVRLCWKNTEAWLAPVTISYSVKAFSITAVRQQLDVRLFEAAEGDSPEAVVQCLANGASVHALDSAGNTPLLRAALADQAANVSALLTARADANATDRHGNQALHLAALSGATRALGALLTGGASLDARNAEGATPLLLAAFRRGTREGAGAAAVGEEDEDVANALLGARADISVADKHGNTAVMLAAAAGHEQLLERLLSAGASPTGANLRGDTALSLATARGSGLIVESLLAAAAMAQDRRGGPLATEVERSLHLALTAAAAAADSPRTAVAALERCRTTVRLLASHSLSAGAAAAALAAAPTAVISRALLLSCEEGAGAELAALRLLESGAPLSVAKSDEPDAPGPLTLAAAAGHAPLVSLLLRRSAQASTNGAPSLRASDQRLALKQAVADGNIAVVHAFLEAEGDVPMKRHLLREAARSGHTGLTLMLLGSGARPDDDDGSTDGATALHAAATGGHTMLALALYRRGYPLGALDQRGRTVMQAAMDAGFEQTAIALLRAASDDDALRCLRQQVLAGRECM
jgi:ankyrin repeat protein